MKILIVNPHLSTGGCPEYLYQFILHNKHKYTALKVVEFSNFSYDYIVQKNKIKNLIGEENLFSLGNLWEEDSIFESNKYRLLDIIKEYNPDIIWFNEFPECFEYKLPPENLIKAIYNSERNYKIVETTHCNHFDFNKKVFIPDEFMFCSELHLEKSKHIDIKKYIWEVPIQNKERPNREATLKSLGLDPSYLHILNVAIFNQNKNQKYIFDLAEKLKFYKIKFHFIGNSCFLNECGISQNQLSLNNCKVWGERSDVDLFMSCMDIFLFPSHKELNPLSVKEALSWNMEVICKKFPDYTDKYLGKSNFNLIEDINISEFFLQKLKNLNVKPLNRNDEIKFALYTSFYNCSKYVDTIFSNILNLKYDNFTWFITDDFSTDDTKDTIFNKLKILKTDKIKYVEQKFKKQMYWQPNVFIDKSFEYIVLIDADDFFDLNFLNIYNKFLSADKSIHLITSDFKKIDESSGSLHSLGLLNNNKPLKSKINEFHSSIDYLNNLNYYCFGYLRCFKNINDLEFSIKNFDACAEDSYHTMYVNSYGKWLHIPRNLYTWTYRQNSESHSSKKENFNDNFEIAYEKLMNSESLVDNRFNSLYKETCALNYLNLNFNENISIFTKNKNAELLHDLFFDKKLVINDYSYSDIYVFVYNDFKDFQINEIVKNLKNKNAKIIIYHQFDKTYNSNTEKDFQINKDRDLFLKNLSKIFNIDNWYSYIRHLYITGTINKDVAVDVEQNDVIDVFNFDPSICKLEYNLLNEEEGVYDLKVNDCNSNFSIYKEKIKLNKNINYWTCFGFAKNIIYDDVWIKFLKNGKEVFNKKFKINNSPSDAAVLFKDMQFDSDFECSSYVEVFVLNQYNKYGISVEKDDVVVDIGANLGAFIKLSLTNECKKIYCCEPNENCTKLIKKYYGNNEKLIINEYAISDTVGISHLKVDINNKISGASQLVNAKAFGKETSDLIEVKTNTFANFIKENNIETIDYLKVDCEGGENFIFNKDNAEFIKNNVKKIALEYHNEYKDEIKKLLIDLGFTVIEDIFETNLGFIYARKAINIINESGSLGDCIAWVPIVNEFAIQNKEKVNFYTPNKELFINQYPMINFFDYTNKPQRNDNIVIGCFDEKKWRPSSLQQIACDILKIDNKEIHCKIDIDKTKKSNFNKKYVCIATQSTSQCKYWNKENGWTEVVDYLKNLGYEVVCIDKHYSYGDGKTMNAIPYNAIDKTGNLPLADRINDIYHCEFFIGLGSGLSWLAWACEKPVIMISGFSDPKSEFHTPYRVHNKNICNSCWNDPEYSFDRSNWLWCPRNKNFECSREITFDMVKEKIDKCISDLKTKDDYFK
jgi:autotransporter strand-loop-strand O-heptosyltransferase